MDLGHLLKVYWKNSYVWHENTSKNICPSNLTNRCFDSFREAKVILMTTDKSVVKQDIALAREQFQFDFRYMNPKCACDEDWWLMWEMFLFIYFSGL